MSWDLIGCALLAGVVGLGCGSEATDDAPTAPSSSEGQDPAKRGGQAPTPEELLRQIAEAEGPPGLALAIEPEVRAWETRQDRWAVEVTLTVTNGSDEPVVFDPNRLRVRDQRASLAARVQGDESRRTLDPGQSTQVRVVASHHPADSGQPTELRVDYGIAGAMSPVVTAPVRAVPTDGLVATFRDVQRARREHSPYVHPRGSLPKWQVRLTMEIANPTDHLVRVPFGGLSAVREDGTPSYWGDHAGVSLEDRWLEPGERRDALVILMFHDSPQPPQRVTLTYGAGPPVTVEVPGGR